MRRIFGKKRRKKVSRKYILGTLDNIYIYIYIYIIYRETKDEISGKFI